MKQGGDNIREGFVKKGGLYPPSDTERPDWTPEPMIPQEKTLDKAALPMAIEKTERLRQARADLRRHALGIEAALRRIDELQSDLVFCSGSGDTPSRR